MNANSLALLPALVIMAVILDILPRRPRRGLYFGVTTGEAFARSEEGRAIARRYRFMVWAGTLLALVLLPLSAGAQPVAAQVAVGAAAWLHARRRAAPHAIQPPSVRTAVLAGEPSAPLGALLALLASFAVLAAAGTLLYLNYDALPERIPTHYGFSGKADAFRLKTPGRVALPVVIGVLTWMLLALNLYGIAYGTRRGGSPETRVARDAQRVYFGRLLAMLELVLSGLFAYLAVSPLVDTQRLAGSGWIMPALTVLLLVGPVWAVLRWHEQAGGAGDDTPDAYWMGGMFYWNASDPVLMVERRDGVGYTPNFAHPFAWAQGLIVLALITLPLMLYSMG
ncbi:MAG: DUF1648 domain-containing protein [Bryobacterales bacterium]|nr:DUF1648 domain-containing protein [Bryobacterales bacterium]